MVTCAEWCVRPLHPAAVFDSYTRLLCSSFTLGCSVRELYLVVVFVSYTWLLCSRRAQPLCRYSHPAAVFVSYIWLHHVSMLQSSLVI